MADMSFVKSFSGMNLIVINSNNFIELCYFSWINSPFVWRAFSSSLFSSWWEWLFFHYLILVLCFKDEHCVLCLVFIHTLGFRITKASLLSLPFAFLSWTLHRNFSLSHSLSFLVKTTCWSGPESELCGSPAAFMFVCFHGWMNLFCVCSVLCDDGWFTGCFTSFNMLFWRIYHHYFFRCC